ncbi:MAG: sulfurtransferase [Rhizobiales bacterium]|nr:sulfurtransferase [Hyphomicrobiales bacterium]
MTDIPQTLVDPAWLEARLGDPKVRIIALNFTDSQDFDAGHIPGAVYWDWKGMLWDPLMRDFPNAETFAMRCAAAGITNDTTVVFYGDPAVQFGTYAWWVFKYCGHQDARVLNGSRVRWECEGRPLTAERSKIEATHYTPNTRLANAHMRAMRNDVLAALDRKDTVILDHRSPEEYHGELLSPPGSPNHGAERLGRIPGAKHLYFEDFLGEDKSFKPVEEIRALLREREATPDKNIISYCRLSHRATLAYFAMTELLGYPNVRSYDGSWTEWGSVVGVPIER